MSRGVTLSCTHWVLPSPGDNPLPPALASKYSWRNLCSLKEVFNGTV